MTYNPVQPFQINDYANHYVDIEITGYRALYSNSIAGVVGLVIVSWIRKDLTGANFLAIHGMC